MAVVQEQGHHTRRRHSGPISICSSLRGHRQPGSTSTRHRNSDISHVRCSRHRTYWEFPFGRGLFFPDRAAKHSPACSSLPEVVPQGMDASRPHPFPSPYRSHHLRTAQHLWSWAFHEVSVRTFLQKLL